LGSGLRLADTHCHLYCEPLGSKAAEALSRARDAGLEFLVVPADELSSWRLVESLRQDGFVHPALGLHPWMSDQQLDLSELRRRLDGCGAVAVGEIGLDRVVEAPPFEVQLRCFESQLDLALEMDLPVLLHCRKAFDDMESVLKSRGSSFRGILHAFSKSPDIARRFASMGLLIAFGGAVTRPHARKARASAAALPLEEMVLETDAPSIGMQDIPPEDVEPWHVRLVADAIAGVRGVTASEVGEVTTDAARRLLRLC
jgi:TatD DNase family protein